MTPTEMTNPIECSSTQVELPSVAQEFLDNTPYQHSVIGNIDLILMNKDCEDTTVSFAFDTGSADDPVGQLGMSHLNMNDICSYLSKLTQFGIKDVYGNTVDFVIFISLSIPRTELVPFLKIITEKFAIPKSSEFQFSEDEIESAKQETKFQPDNLERVIHALSEITRRSTVGTYKSPENISVSDFQKHLNLINNTRMCICIIGHVPSDIVEAVEKFLSEMPERDRVTEKPYGPPENQEQIEHVHFFEFETSHLIMECTLPEKQGPLEVISEAIQCGENNCLISSLKEEGWIDRLYVNNRNFNSEERNEIFRIFVDLTPEGRENWPEIAFMIKKNLNKLQDKGVCDGKLCEKQTSYNDWLQRCMQEEKSFLAFMVSDAVLRNNSLQEMLEEHFICDFSNEDVKKCAKSLSEKWCFFVTSQKNELPSPIVNTDYGFELKYKKEKKEDIFSKVFLF